MAVERRCSVKRNLACLLCVHFSRLANKNVKSECLDWQWSQYGWEYVRVSSLCVAWIPLDETFLLDKPFLLTWYKTAKHSPSDNISFIRVAYLSNNNFWNHSTCIYKYLLLSVYLFCPCDFIWSFYHTRSYDETRSPFPRNENAWCHMRTIPLANLGESLVFCFKPLEMRAIKYLRHSSTFAAGNIKLIIIDVCLSNEILAV